MHHDVPDRDGGKIGSLVFAPTLATVHRDPKPEFGSKEEQVGVLSIFGDHVRVTSYAIYIQCRPRFAQIGCFVDIRFEITQGVAIESRISGVGIEATRGDRRYSRPLW